MPSAHSERNQELGTSAKRRRILPNRFIDAVIGRGGTVNLPCENECDIKRAFYEAEGSILFNDPLVYGRASTHARRRLKHRWKLDMAMHMCMFPGQSRMR